MHLSEGPTTSGHHGYRFVRAQFEARIGGKFAVLSLLKTRCPPVGGAAKRRTTKFDPKPSDAGICGHFSNFDKYRSEVASDVMFVVDVHATFGGSGLNSGRMVRPVVRITLGLCSI